MNTTDVGGPVSELLARASHRQAVRTDGRSGATFERVVIDSERFFVKRLSPATDWIMRTTGDRVHRNYQVWRGGIMDRVPTCIDHTVVAMECHGTGDDAVVTMLMRDVGDRLIPDGDTPIDRARHATFIRHLAELSAAFWGWADTSGELATMRNRLLVFAPETLAPELRAPEVPDTVAAAARGWNDLPRRSPVIDRIAHALFAQPEILLDPLADTPATFLHGDWKLANLGAHGNGRTILLDWAIPGAGPVCWDLCWYVSLNRARLPEDKDAVFARLRAELEGLGIATDPWWERQLDLCLVAMTAAFAWEKALGDEDELRWWERRAVEAVRRLGLPL